MRTPWWPTPHKGRYNAELRFRFLKELNVEGKEVLLLMDVDDWALATETAMKQHHSDALYSSGEKSVAPK